MQEESITISKQKPSHPSMDYTFLRQKGLEQIQKLAGKTWTDHNAHDPGITILEILCYAITELGYRTNYDIVDILSSSEESLESNFYTAAQILPCNPLTSDDFRRLIIDCPGVRNAWLEKPIKYEQDIYFDESGNKLSYKTGPRVRLSGLFDVQIEFEEDFVYKPIEEDEASVDRGKEDLNSNIIKWKITDNKEVKWCLKK